MSELLHIFREYSWWSEVFMGIQKFRNLTHKWDIFSIMWIFDISNMAIFGGWPRKLNITKMSLPDVNSICLNGGQKYKIYLSPPFSRKNLSYWPMCRKTQIFAISFSPQGHYMKFQDWLIFVWSFQGTEYSEAIEFWKWFLVRWKHDQVNFWKI